MRAYVDGELIEVATPPKLNRRQNHTISVVVDRLVVRAEDRGRLADSLETALKLADGVVEVAQRRRGNGRDVLRAIRLPDVRHLAARARAAPFLLQLAVRRVRDVRRTRNAPARERSSSSSAIRSISILEGVVLPWGEPSGYCARSCCRRSRVSSGSTSTRRGAICRSRVRDAILYGDEARQRGQQEGARRRRVGRRPRATSSGGTTNRSPTRCAWSCRSTWSRCRARRASGRRLKPRGARRHDPRAEHR